MDMSLKMIALSSVDDGRRWMEYLSEHKNATQRDFSDYSWNEYHHLFTQKKGHYDMEQYIVSIDCEDKDKVVDLHVKYLTSLKSPLDRVIKR